MPTQRTVHAVVAILALAGWAFAQSAPAVGLSPQELVNRLAELNKEQPAFFGTVTAAQQAKGAEACALFKANIARADLEERAKRALAVVGMLGAYAAGDADTLLAAAQVEWLLEGEGKQAATAQQLLWAGVFAGKPAAAKEAAEFLTKRGGDAGDWAKSLANTIQSCDKPLDLTIGLIEGGQVSLPKFRGKVVVLYFWATWHEPCIKEMPQVKAFHDQRKDDKNFLLVGLSLDRTVQDARNGIKEQGLTWPQAMDLGLRKKFDDEFVPYAVVVGPSGRVAWQGHPGARTTLEMVTDFCRRQAEVMAKSAGARAETRPAPTSTPAVKPPAATPEPDADANAEAEQKYQLVKTYLKAGMRQRARETLKEIVQKYPDSPAARKAQEDLKSMGE